jgi:hypothetical protein
MRILPFAPVRRQAVIRPWTAVDVLANVVDDVGELERQPELGAH